MIRTQKHIGFLTILLLTAVFMALVSSMQAVMAANGADFRAGRIIDDSIFMNKAGFSIAQTQAFLNSKMPSCDENGSETSEYGGGTRAQYATSRGYGDTDGNGEYFTCLKDYHEVPKTQPSAGVPANNYGNKAAIPAGAKSAAEIIWQAGQDYNINPQVLLVTLQKEQALLTDEWPFKNQYLYAMGAHCPDGASGAECDPNYSGFSLQIREGARLFRYYIDNMGQPWWTFAKPGLNNILYNVSSLESICGRKAVQIENVSTAALYTYTPYTPNQAALDNLYGTGDQCSAYGNRNFGRMFTDWFGTTLGDSFFRAIADNGDPRQWVVQNGKRHYIPDIATLKAWGLENTPLFTINASYLGSFPDGSNISRLMRPPGTLHVYFIDGAKRYHIVDAKAFAAWGLNPLDIIDVGDAFSRLPKEAGTLGYAVQNGSDSTRYLLDGGILRQFTNLGTAEAFEGSGVQPVKLSADYFNSLTKGSALANPRISDDDGKDYVVLDQKRYVLSDQLKEAYPWTPAKLTRASLARMPVQTAQPIVRGQNNPTVYLIDKKTKNNFTDPDVLAAWQSGFQAAKVMTMPDSTIDLITSGRSISGYTATHKSNSYVIDSGRRPIPNELRTAYTTGKNPYPLSDEIAALLGTGPAVTGMIRAKGDPKTYLLSGNARKRHITSIARLQMWGGQKPGVTQLSKTIIGSYASAAQATVYVSDGLQNYLVTGGVKRPIADPVAADWGLDSAQVFTDGTLSRLPTASQVGVRYRSGGAYYLIDNGSAYKTTDTNIAEIWNLSAAPEIEQQTIDELLSVKMLTRAVRSSKAGDTRIFVVSDGKLYHLSPAEFVNHNLLREPLAAVDPEGISKDSVLAWDGVLVRVGSAVFVIDGGTVRLAPSGPIRNQWTMNDTIEATAVTDAFLAFYPRGPQVERAIKGSGDPVYLADGVQKRWIRTGNTYLEKYAPYTSVSDNLIQVLATGPEIN